MIAYHAFHEFVAMGDTLTGHIRLNDNQVDFLIKVVIGHKCKHLVSSVLFDMMGIPNNGQESSFSVLAKFFHIIMIAEHEYAFEGTRKIWPR